MIVETDRRNRWQPVCIRMSEAEFHDTVEWLELIASDDGFTKDLREQHDRLFPTPDPEAA